MGLSVERLNESDCVIDMWKRKLEISNRYMYKRAEVQDNWICKQEIPEMPPNPYNINLG